VDSQERRLVAGRYRLLSPLGTGGMGTVWRAEDEVLGRPVAVKEVTFPHGLSDEDRDVLRERTRREARAAARLDHPSAVTVFDVVEEDGAPYLVMELVEADTLSHVVRTDGPLSPERTAQVGLALLGALEAAHRQGIVHRDVKPGNVLLSTGEGAADRVVLTDFGIASSAGDSSITSTGLLLGSPAYIAPERARGEAPGPPSDLWSLGATLFTAVEGKPPYDGGDPLTTVTAVVTGDHVPFALAGPLQPAIEGLLERDPADRSDVARARAQLEQVAAGAAPLTLPPLPPEEPTAAKPQAERTTALEVEEVREAAADVEQRAWSRPAVPPRRRRRSRLPLALTALVVLLAAAVVGLVLATDPGRSPLSALDPRADEPTASAPPSEGPAALPAGWTRYEEPDEGWSIGVPPGYVQSTYRGTQVQLRDQQHRRTLRIDFSDDPAASALAAWQAFSPQLAGQLAQYDELRLEEVDFQGLDAADLEFTYFDETRLHVLDRTAISADGDRGIALYWQVPEERWQESLPVFEQIAATFSFD
jgi:tRNA A-37 threonylcarbamoyl transferase component Bud32